MTKRCLNRFCARAKFVHSFGEMRNQFVTTCKNVFLMCVCVCVFCVGIF